MATEQFNAATHCGFSKRQMLKSVASGFGYLAFSGLAHEAAASRGRLDRAEESSGTLVPKSTHHPARAKRVIFLCMNGGPSHVDLLDYKPELQAANGRSTTIGQDRGGAKLLSSPFQFARHGQSGLWLSETLPHLARHADDLCIINSMHTDLPNHSDRKSVV